MTCFQSWQGKNIKAIILFSKAGIAQQIWISNKNGAILIDTGDGTLRDILASELKPEQIKGIIFTHGHFDHTGGLHSILGFMRMVGRKEPLPVIAPKDCTEVFSTVDNFIQCYPDTIPFDISCIEARDRDTYRIADMEITAYTVVHHGSINNAGILDRIPAMGYRISYDGESIAISGDTGNCPALKELVKGADLAIIEATYRNSSDISKEALEKVHLSEDLAEQIGKLAGEYILVHKGKRE